MASDIVRCAIVDGFVRRPILQVSAEGVLADLAKSARRKLPAKRREHLMLEFRKA